jgi:hypothetical protein
MAREEAEDVGGKATVILNNVLPKLGYASKVEAMRAELEAKANDDSSARWEDLKQQAEAAARAKLEEQKAAEAEIKDEEEDAAPDDGEEQAGGEASGGIDVDKSLEDALAAVERPEVVPVTDRDVLSALMEADVDLKDKIISMMALQRLGARSWVNDNRFEQEFEPTEKA